MHQRLVSQFKLVIFVRQLTNQKLTFYQRHTTELREAVSLKTYELNGDREMMLLILPLFHSYYGLTTCLLFPIIPMFRGAKIMTIPKFDPKAFVKSIKDMKVSCLLSS
jgi:hypothetical protein